jgi:hypothetical protein
MGHAILRIVGDTDQQGKTGFAQLSVHVLLSIDESLRMLES